MGSESGLSMDFRGRICPRLQRPVVMADCAAVDPRFEFQKLRPPSLVGGGRGIGTPPHYAVSSMVISNIKGMDDRSPKETFLWLKEKMDDQGSWDEQAQCNACASAAGYGSLEVLKWHG